MLSYITTTSTPFKALYPAHLDKDFIMIQRAMLCNLLVCKNPLVDSLKSWGMKHASL